jgi:hypothetical protein
LLFLKSNLNYQLRSLAFSMKNFNSISCEIGLFSLCSLCFTLSSDIFILSSFLKDVLLNRWFLVDSVLSSLWTCPPSAFWTPLFLVRGQLLVLLRFTYLWWAIFLCYFQDFLLSLTFSIFTMMCLDLFVFILFGLHWTSWMYRVNLFFKFGKSVHKCICLYTLWCAIVLCDSAHFPAFFFFLFFGLHNIY